MHFHPRSYGFRPQRSAHQAVGQLQADVREGRRWVVDLDLEAFFDRVNHDRLMSRLKRRVGDVSLLRLINRYLKVGVRMGERARSMEHQQVGAWPVAPVEDPGACAGANGAVLSQFGAAEFGSALEIQFIEPPCT